MAIEGVIGEELPHTMQWRKVDFTLTETIQGISWVRHFSGSIDPFHSYIKGKWGFLKG